MIIKTVALVIGEASLTVYREEAKKDASPKMHFLLLS